MIKYTDFKILKDRTGISTYQLINTYGISPQIISNIKNSKDISTNTLGKLCKIYKLTPNDIIKFDDVQ